ncbi:Ankyrin repeat domain-containing protein 50 [Hondaea fermentalgiana]|uniref:Ankyrin repeat domain-containing protein 50 n=1 Tax=Hondaea fermentalgiana TaxID=2315210 RepID=A0A2R5GU86_9STRA|nr:Ankyrin repeat domain-containing protein 50 [Hondaea fermentalgiana]|eukprot:GBG33318.1 Ankyrin repeat domain-containing protein 50 [Hondaea fermentalgiana]
MQTLEDSINRDDLVGAKELVEEDRSILTRRIGRQDFTPLITALYWTDGRGLRIANWLLDQDEYAEAAVLDAKTRAGWTALMQAVKNRQIGIIKRLIMRGADLNVQKTDGYTALLLACARGYYPEAKLLIKSGAMLTQGLAQQQELGWTELLFACAQGKKVMVTLLLQKGADVNMANKDDWTALKYACSKGHSEITKLLIKEGAKTDPPDLQGLTALMLASQQGHVETAKILLEHGASINAKDGQGRTALMIASVSKTSSEVVSLLISGQADVNLLDNEGETALTYASKIGNVLVVDQLVQAGANIDHQPQDGGWSALMHACFYIRSKSQCLKVIETLLNAGANPNLQGQSGVSALIIACQFKQKKAADLLIQKGANLDLTTKKKFTALMYCCSEKPQPEAKSQTSTEKLETMRTIARSLIEHGADVDIEECRGRTALMFACEHGHDDIAKLLIERGAKLDVQEAKGWTALMFASHCGRIQELETMQTIAQFLIEHGADVDIEECRGRTALMFACEHGHDDIAKLLIERGAKLDVQEAEGWTALMFASHCGRIQRLETMRTIARSLIEHGADVDIEECRGRTALMFACEHGHDDIAKLLIERGAKLDVQEAEGWTALMFASYNGRIELVRALFLQGANPNLGSPEDKGSHTALLLACQRRPASMLKGDAGLVQCFMTCWEKGGVLDKERARKLARRNGLLKVLKFIDIVELLEGPYTEIANRPAVVTFTSSHFFSVREHQDTDAELDRLEIFDIDLRRRLASILQDGVNPSAPSRSSGARSDSASDAATQQGSDRTLSSRQSSSQDGSDAHSSASTLSHSAAAPTLPVVGQAPQFDAFLAHDWGEGGMNHETVALINDELGQKGIETWFDRDRLEREIDSEIARGVRNSRKFVIFLTQNYMDKVESFGYDFCRYEFSIAMQVHKKDLRTVLIVVMEEPLLKIGMWRDRFLIFQQHVFVDFSTKEQRAANLDYLVKRIRDEVA